MDINYFMKIQNACGTKTKREKELVKTNKNMSKHFEDTYDTEDVLLNGKPFKLMIIKDTDGNTYKKKIKSRHEDKFNLGDYITWNDQVWLITLLDSDEKTWNRGYMYQCSILLRWQNANGDIVERYGYSEDFTKYSTGITGNNTITVGEYQYGITLPVDDETKIVKRDKRFPVDIDGVEPPDVYKLTNRKILLTDNRAFGRGGILTWTLSFSEFNKETDKKITLLNGTEAWICDYISSTASLPSSTDSEESPMEPSNKTTISFTISGNKNLKLGIPRTYTTTITDENDNVIEWSNALYHWNVISDFEIKETLNENKIELLVSDEDSLGYSFLLQILKLDDNSVMSELEITVTEAF